MAYDGRLMRRALLRFDEDKKRREEELRQREERVYAREPRLRQIDQELRSTMSRIIATALRQGTDPRAAVERLRDRNLELQREKRELLLGMGLPADCLEEKPACPLCGDTGYQGEVVCRCLRAYYAREQKKELSALLDLGSQSFDTFSLDWYSPKVDARLGISPRENMEGNRDVCVDYAYDFGKGSGNLLLTGQPGLGKTFLSACIARVVSEKGFSVVNIDATLLAQAPKVGPYRAQMAENMAAALKIDPEQVNVKATTEEKLGFTGDGSGMAAHAVVLLEKVK